MTHNDVSFVTPLDTPFTSTLLECANRCIKHGNCQGITYKAGSSECIIGDDTNSLSYKQGFILFEMV